MQIDRLSLVLALSVLAAGCKRGSSAECEDVSVDTSLHPNSASFSMVTAEPATVSVSYTVDGGEPQQRDISAEPQTAHSGGLFGLSALAEVEYTAEAVLTSGQTLTCSGAFTTNNLPPELPELTTTTYDDGALSSERVLLGVAMSDDETHPFALDRVTGDIIWYGDSADYYSATQIEVAADGDGLLVSSFSFDRIEDLGTLHRVDLFGQVQETAPLEGGHHFFRQLDATSLAYPSIDPRPWTNREGEEIDVAGDALIVLGPDGPVEVFNAWDHLEPVEHGSFYSPFYPEYANWTHLNSIDYLDEQDVFLVSMPFLHVIYEIDGGTGEILTELSEDTLDFGEYPLREAHDAQMVDGDTLSTINHYPNKTVAIDYTIDHSAGTAEATWTYDSGIKADFMGQHSRLGNGNHLINYGSAGVIQEVTPAGEVVWELELALGYWFGNGQAIERLDDAAP